MSRITILFIFALLFISCEDSYKLNDGERRAFIEEYDTESKGTREFAAHVEIRNGVV